MINNNIFKQNAIAGPPIIIDVKTKDDASGPKINLPPHKNFWDHRKQKQTQTRINKSSKNKNLRTKQHQIYRKWENSTWLHCYPSKAYRASWFWVWEETHHHFHRKKNHEPGHFSYSFCLQNLYMKITNAEKSSIHLIPTTQKQKQKHEIFN